MIREAFEKGRLSKDLREVREHTWETAGGPAFQETAHAKALKQKPSWCSRGRYEADGDVKQCGQRRREQSEVREATGLDYCGPCGH